MDTPLDWLQLAATILGGVGIPLFVIEYVWLWRSRRVDQPRINETLANLSPLIPYLLTAGLAFALWGPVFEAVEESAPWTLPITWWSALLAVLVADAVYYWEHRLEHQVRGLWALYHSVHHSSPVFEQSTAYRISFVDSFATPVFFLPMVLAGFRAELTFLGLGVVIAYQTWIHTEMVRRLPAWFEYVFNTASHHRVHHGSQPGYLDRNYGGLLIVWDRMWGTFQAETETPRYGLTKEIGSSNPVMVHLCELRRLIADVRLARTWSDRWRLVAGRPGWAPTGMTASGG